MPRRRPLAAAAGLAVTVVNRPEFEGSGLSVSSPRGARYVGAATLDEHSPNRDAEIQVTREVEVSDRACIHTTTTVLELGNDLHGADLWSA